MIPEDFQYFGQRGWGGQLSGSPAVRRQGEDDANGAGQIVRAWANARLCPIAIVRLEGQ